MHCFFSKIAVGSSVAIFNLQRDIEKTRLSLVIILDGLQWALNIAPHCGELPINRERPIYFTPARSKSHNAKKYRELCEEYLLEAVKHKTHFA